MIHTDEISTTIHEYLRRCRDETVRLAPVAEALARPGGLTSRKTFSGHVTCSAIVLDPAGRVLHIRHNALRRWLRPGGHLEDSDASLIEAARREVAEETGIPAGGLTPLDHLPVDVDVHLIPANPPRASRPIPTLTCGTHSRPTELGR